MKGILSSNIEHYRYTMEALQEEEFIARYICCAFFDKKPWYYNYFGSFKRWIDNRIEENFDYSKVSSFRNQEIIYKLIRNSSIFNGISKGKIDRLFNGLFDYRSEKILKKFTSINFFHYVSGIGYSSALEAKKRFNCKIIVDDRAEHKGFLHDILTEEYRKLNIEFDDVDFWDIDCRRDYEIADYIITPSTFSKKTFIEKGIEEKKLVVIPYGCNTELFYPIESIRNDDKFRVIYVGSICVRKGAHYLIDAIKKIKDKNIEIILIGKVEKQLEGFMKELPGNIKHIPYVPNNELKKYYSNSDVFVLPSLSDSFSLATLEAMASGLPVIVSENVGAKDFVKEGINGYIVPIKNADILKEKIIYLYENKELTRAMGIKSREISLEVNWNKYKDDLIKFYKALNKEC